MKNDYIYVVRWINKDYMPCQSEAMDWRDLISLKEHINVLGGSIETIERRPFYLG